MSDGTGTGPDTYDTLVSPHDQADIEHIEQGTTPNVFRGASLSTMVLIASPRLATQMTWAAQWAALGPYLSTMLPNYAVQLTQLIGPLTGILLAPTVGVCSDRSTNKWGRRRPFMFYAAIASCVCWLGMAFTRDFAENLGDHGDQATGSRKWTAFFTVAFYLWMDITVNVAQTPSQLLIADFAGERQTLGAGIGQAWSVLGSVIVSVYISCFGPAHKSLKPFLGMLIVAMLVTVSVACYAAKEQPLTRDDAKVSRAAMIRDAFKSIRRGLQTLPESLIIYGIIFFCMCYGNSSYIGNKGQFFGVIVKNGTADGADNCDPCTEKQKAYNDGVQVASGVTDLLHELVGYAFSWMLPIMVKKWGAKPTLVVSLLPQAALVIMAVCKVVWIDALLAVLTAFSQTAIFAMIVPIIINVIGDKGDIGMYVGALNSVNCLGQVVNFLASSGLVETSMSFKLPVLVGGIVATAGTIICIFLFKIKMYSM